MPTDIITTATAAKILRVTVRRVQQFVADGKLTEADVGGRDKLVSRREVEAFAKVDRPTGRPRKEMKP